jgi:hypothetical protein
MRALARGGCALVRWDERRADTEGSESSALRRLRRVVAVLVPASSMPRCRMAGNRNSRISNRLCQSGRQDLNLRPLGPEPSALARLSHAPLRFFCATYCRLLVGRTHLGRTADGVHSSRMTGRVNVAGNGSCRRLQFARSALAAPRRSCLAVQSVATAARGLSDSLIMHRCGD